MAQSIDIKVYSGREHLPLPESPPLYNTLSLMNTLSTRLAIFILPKHENLLDAPGRAFRTKKKKISPGAPRILL
jgi:hypothetical protein